MPQAQQVMPVPTPTTWKIEEVKNAKGDRLVMVQIFSLNGAFTFFVTPGEAIAIGRALGEEGSGLTIAPAQTTDLTKLFKQSGATN